MIFVTIGFILWLLIVALKYNLGHCHKTKSAFTKISIPFGILTSCTDKEDLEFNNIILTQCEQDNFELNFKMHHQQNSNQKKKKQKNNNNSNNSNNKNNNNSIEIGDTNKKIKDRSYYRNCNCRSSCNDNSAGDSGVIGVAYGNKCWRSENNKNSFQATVVVTNSKCTNKTTSTEKTTSTTTTVASNRNNLKTNRKRTSSGLTKNNSLISSSIDLNRKSQNVTLNWSRKRKAEFNKKNSTFSWRLQAMQPSFSEQEFAQFLERYIIDLNLLRTYGYPMLSTVNMDCVEFSRTLPKINKNHPHHLNHQNQIQSHQYQYQQDHDHDHQDVQQPYAKLIKINSIEKSPKVTLTEKSLNDSDHGSSDDELESASKKTFIINNHINNVVMSETVAYDNCKHQMQKYNHTKQRQCVRCHRNFEVTETGEYLKRESCTFHWGKLYELHTKNIFAVDVDVNVKEPIYQYTCCKGDSNSHGCVQNEMHVWTGAVDGLNGPFKDFVLTKPRKINNNNNTNRNNYNKNNNNVTNCTKIVALDCEMSFTLRGLDVTKITVVAYDGSIVYEHFVKPNTEILDYNTRFSGITEKDLSPESNNSIKTLNEVKNDLLQIIDEKTILIGHGLDNDLRALRIVHTNIVDTSIVFPHANGFPFRRSLKHLTKVYLRRDIQNNEFGHSSLEDSRACLDLMLWKMHKEWCYH